MLIDYGITHQKLLAFRDCISVLKKFPQALLDQELAFLREWIIIDMQGTIDPENILDGELDYDCIDINIQPSLSTESYQLSEHSGTSEDALNDNEYIQFGRLNIQLECNETMPADDKSGQYNYPHVTNTMEQYEPGNSCEEGNINGTLELKTDNVNFFSSTEIKQDCVNSKNTFMCSICGRCYSQKLYLRKHMKLHSVDLVCSLCGKELLTMEGMKDHMLGHKGIKNHTCEICAKSFVSRKTLSAHQKLHRFTKPLCTICKREFTQESSLMRHIKNVHQHEKQYICQICGKCFGQDGGLKSHMRVHHGDNECKDCNKNFSDLTSFRRHRRFMHHDYPTRTIACKMCDKKFSTEYTLQKHVKCIHEKKISFVCETCGKNFAYKNSLRMHMAVHTKSKDSRRKKKFKCEICGKEMWTLISLRDHISAVHHGKKNYKCEQCGKEFAFHDSMIIHRNVHLNILKYKCNICSRAFKWRGTLNKHKRLHNGEKPYKCTECKSTFTQKSTLNSHMICQHTKEYPHKCMQCGKGFIKPKELIKHMKIKH
uniref:C2H2-type domain-containing protein n=1 Tax=Ciona savignyi TaxID=51511 RepID=H2Z1L6_CIOSA